MARIRSVLVGILIAILAAGSLASITALILLLCGQGPAKRGPSAGDGELRCGVGGEQEESIGELIGRLQERAEPTTLKWSPFHLPAPSPEVLRELEAGTVEQIGTLLIKNEDGKLTFYQMPPGAGDHVYEEVLRVHYELPDGSIPTSMCVPVSAIRGEWKGREEVVRSVREKLKEWPTLNDKDREATAEAVRSLYARIAATAVRQSLTNSYIEKNRKALREALGVLVIPDKAEREKGQERE